MSPHDDTAPRLPGRRSPGRRRDPFAIAVGTHDEVVLGGVRGWRPGHPPERRFRASCRVCGEWSGPTLDAVHAVLLAVPCAPRTCPEPV